MIVSSSYGKIQQIRVPSQNPSHRPFSPPPPATVRIYQLIRTNRTPCLNYNDQLYIHIHTFDDANETSVKQNHPPSGEGTKSAVDIDRSKWDERSLRLGITSKRTRRGKKLLLELCFFFAYVLVVASVFSLLRFFGFFYTSTVDFFTSVTSFFFLPSRLVFLLRIGSAAVQRR